MSSRSQSGGVSSEEGDPALDVSSETEKKGEHAGDEEEDEEDEDVPELSNASVMSLSLRPGVSLMKMHALPRAAHFEQGFWRCRSHFTRD